METQPNQFIESFLSHLKLPAGKPAKQYVVGIIGQIGAGKTKVSRMLTDSLPGTVVVSANSARYLLKEAGMPWGDNVRSIIEGVISRLISRGYAVIVDGGTAEERERTAIARASGSVPVLYVYVQADTETCITREQSKYEDQTWQSSFEDFRVKTIDKIIDNIRAREALHKELRSSISNAKGFIGEIDNGGTLNDLTLGVDKTHQTIRQKLGV